MVHRPEQGHLEVDPLGEALLHRALPGLEGVEHPEQGLDLETPAQLVGRAPVADRLKQRLPDQPRKVGQDAGEILSLLGETVGESDQPAVVGLGESRSQSREIRLPGEAENGEHIGFGDGRSAEGNQLVEDGLGVPHSTVGELRDGPERGRLRLDALAGGDLGEAGDDRGILDGPELKPLATRDDGRQDFLALGCGEDELHVGRGLFEGLEQRVEGSRGKHVDLVDDVDLEGTLRGAVLAVLAQIADLLDRVVGGSVDFDHVHAAPAHDRLHQVRLRVEIHTRAGAPVQRAGEEPGGAGLARPARPDEKVGVGQAVPLDRVGKGADDVFLPDQIAEPLRPPAAGNDLVTTFHSRSK